MAKKLKSLNPIIGTGYKTLSTIKDGEDGNIENFPDTLPKIPRLSYKRLGVSGLEIGWEFEDKIYYTYELYGSTTKGFEASEENLIFQGLASSYFYEAKPGEKWYFKARAKNTHGRYTEFSSELVTYTIKLDNLGDYVEGGSINGALIENATINNAHIKDLHADKITAGDIDANRISASVINAINANISNATIDSAKIGNLSANKITAGVLDADRIGANSITANKIEANAITSEKIQANAITTDKLAANIITSSHIQTGAITAGSGIIAEGAIGNAQISSIDAGKISAGKIDTSKVEVAGTDGHLRIKGNRLQVFNGIGNQAKERVSLGDVNGNGSVYGLRVRGADGTTILLDENGVKSEGITDGAITNDKISDDANIDGAKLNINSVVNKINEDGTETIQGTKIEVDGTTLNTKLSTITTKQTEDSERISQAQSQITANTNAIKLKVDEQTYTADKKDMTSKLEKNTSEISAMKGQIALKVEQTDIENAKSEMEGVIDTKVDSAKAEIKVTTDAISQNVSNLSQTVSTKADSSTVTTLSSKVGSLETSVNGISGKVTNLEKTTTTLGTQVSDAQNTANSAINKANNAQSTANTANSTANANKSNITNLQGEVSTVKSNIASLEVTTSGISQKVSSVESTTATLTTKVNNAQSTANQAKTDASNANSNATNALNKANDANSKIDRLEIGSRNILLGTAIQDTSKGNARESVIDTGNTFKDCKVWKSNTAWADIGFYFSTQIINRNVLNVGDTVTYSIYAKTDDTNPSSFPVYAFGGKQNSENGSSVYYFKAVNVGVLTNEWKQYSYTWTITADMMNKQGNPLNSIRFETNKANTSGKYVYWTCPKLEKGNKATDWTPAPEDIDAKITTVDGKVNNALERKMGINMIINQGTFAPNQPNKEGELYIHGFDANGNKADVNGYIVDPKTGNKVTVPKTIINPNDKLPYNQDIYLCWWSNKYICVWYNTSEKKWKYCDANGNTYQATVNNASLSDNILFLGYFTMSGAEMVSSGQLYDAPKFYRDAVGQTIEFTTTKSQVSSIETNLNSITSRVSATETTTSSLTSQINNKENKNDRVIYAKGNGNDAPNNSQVKVGSNTLVNGHGRGLNILALNPTTLAQQYNGRFDTYGGDSGRSDFANKIKELNNGNYIIVVTSHDSACLNYATVCDALYLIGGSAPSTSIASYREAYALIGKSKLGKGNGLEMYIPKTATDARVAEVSVKVSDQGALLGVNSNNSESKIDTLTTRVSTAESKLTKDSLTTTIGNHYTTSNDVNGIVTSKGYQTQSQVQQTVNGLEVKVSQSGGYNLIYNGDFKRQFECWEPNSSYWKFANTITSSNGKGIYCDGDLNTSRATYIKDVVYLEPRANAYTLSYWIYTSANGSDGTTNPYRRAELKIYYKDGSASWHSVGNQTKYNTWEKHVITVQRPSDKEFSHFNLGLWCRDTTKRVYYSMVMLEKGVMANEWTPNPNEIYDGITTIDKDGVTVTASNVKSKTNMSANGFKITKTDTNEDVFKVNSDGTLYMKGQITVTGGSVPTSNLSGTISSNQLNSSITSDINNAKNNASSALSTANTASTNATNALNTANSVNNTVNSNKNNWNNAYNRVNEWAYGAVTGSTNINGGMIATNTITANKMAIADFTNYCEMNVDNCSTYGFTKTTDSSESNNYWMKLNSLARDTAVTSKKNYEMYKGNVQGTYRISFEFNSTVKGATTNGGTDSVLRPIGVGLYCKDKTGANKWYIVSCSSFTSGANTSYTGTVTLDSNIVSFGVYVQINGYAPFTGQLLIRNIKVNKMANGELIVDGAITANKIASGAITATMITSGTLDASKVNVTNLNASNIKSGTISGDRIASNSITADKIAVGAISVDKLSSNNKNPIIKLFDNCSIDATAKNEQGKGNAIRLKWDSMNYILQRRSGVNFYMEPREVGAAFGFQSDYGEHYNGNESRIITREGTLAFRGAGGLVFYTDSSNAGRKLLTAHDLNNSYTSTSTSSAPTSNALNQVYKIANHSHPYASASHSHNGNTWEYLNLNKGYINYLYYVNGNTTDWSVLSTAHLSPNTTNRYLGQSASNRRWQSAFLVSSPNVSSDATLKENIEYLDDNSRTRRTGLLTANQLHNFIKNDLRIAEYDYKIDPRSLNECCEDEQELIRSMNNHQIGFIAQDIVDTEVGAKIVTEDSDGILGYETGNFMAVIAGALQEEIKCREELEAKCADLEERLIKLEKILESKL